MPTIHFVNKPACGFAAWLFRDNLLGSNYTLQCTYTFGDLCCRRCSAHRPQGRMDRRIDHVRDLQVAVASENADAKAPGNGNGSEIAANGEIFGRLIDAATGKPIEGATIACGALINDSGKGGGADAVTDALGRYRLVVPSPGIYNVWLEKYDQNHAKTAAADDGIPRRGGKGVGIGVALGHPPPRSPGNLVDAAGESRRQHAGVLATPPPRRSRADRNRRRPKPTAVSHLHFLPAMLSYTCSKRDVKHPDVPFSVSRSADVFVDVKADGDVPPGH